MEPHIHNSEMTPVENMQFDCPENLTGRKSFDLYPKMGFWLKGRIFTICERFLRNLNRLNLKEHCGGHFEPIGN